ncbi:MAG: PDZ domain-containing protein, partial [Pirellulales bacterium]
GVVPVLANVRPGGPAREAGLQTGDKIVEMNGKPISNRAQLMHQLGPLYAGETVHLVVERKDERLEFDVPLVDKLPPYAHPFLGILPRRASENGQGVVVRYVFPDSAAAAADLQPGDRIVKLAGKTIRRRNDLYDALVSAMPGEEVGIEWKRGDEALNRQVTLGDLPTDVPEKLPPAHEIDKDDSLTVEDVGIVEIKLPEFKNECVAYIPKNYNSAIPHGVLVWLHQPGRFNQKQLLERWKDHCDANDLILLAPRARDSQRWHPDEAEFVNRALAELSEKYEVDAARTVVHGWEAGGVMAFYVFAADKTQIHALAPVDAAMPAQLDVPPLQPAARAAVYWVYGAQHDAAQRIKIQRKEFAKLHYPVTTRELDGTGRYLDDDEVSELVRWIDSLDRI